MSYLLYCDGEPVMDTIGNETGLIHSRVLVDDYIRLHCVLELAKLTERQRNLRCRRSGGDLPKLQQQPDGSLSVFAYGFSFLAIEQPEQAE